MYSRGTACLIPAARRTAVQDSLTGCAFSLAHDVLLSRGRAGNGSEKGDFDWHACDLHGWQARRLKRYGSARGAV